MYIAPKKRKKTKAQKWWNDPEKKKVVCAKISESHRNKKPKREKTRVLVQEGDALVLRSIYLKTDVIRNDTKYTSQRDFVLERDKYSCVECGFKYKEYMNEPKGEYPLQVHHAKSLYSIVKENNIRTLEEALLCDEVWNTENLHTLCKVCHKSTENYFIKALK